MNCSKTPRYALGLFVILVGCGQAPTPVPPDTRPADEKMIRDVETAWAQDWQSKDPEKIASHYTDDATLMVADMPILKGKDAIRGALKQLLADPGVSLSFTPSTVEAAKGGDLGYTQGSYTMTHTDPKTKKVVTEKGKYLTVYKQQADGTWKALEDIANEDAPAK